MQQRKLETTQRESERGTMKGRGGTFYLLIVKCPSTVSVLNN